MHLWIENDEYFNKPINNIWLANQKNTFNYLQQTRVV